VVETANALGMTLSILNEEQRQKFKIDAGLEGAVVTAVDPDGPAAEKRIEPGDVITEAGQKPVGNPADVTARVKDAESASKKSVLLFVAKGGKQSEMRFIAVRIKKD
jgi:serine protease Do